MGRIRFLGGPFDGRSAPHDEAFPFKIQGLLYLPAPPDPDLGSGQPLLPVKACSYFRRDRGIYDFAAAKDGVVSTRDYQAIKRIQNDESPWLHALATDPRIVEVERESDAIPAGALPLDRAWALKEVALPKYRRWLEERMDARDIGTKEAWEIFTIRTLGDIDYSAVGSVLHLHSLRELLRDMFGIEIPLDLPGPERFSGFAGSWWNN